MSICGACGNTSSNLRCSRCKVVHYCSRECQQSHWPTHKGLCCPPIADQASALALLERGCSERELRALEALPQAQLTQWGWDLLDPLVSLLQHAHLQQHVLRLLRRICAECAPSEVFLSLMCHLTSPQQTVAGVDLKLELLNLITSLLPRVKSARRLVDFAHQVYPVLVGQLQTRQEGDVKDYAAFYEAATRFTESLAALGFVEVKEKLCQCQILLLEHRFELDRLQGTEGAASFMSKIHLPSAQVESLLEQKTSGWARQGLTLYLALLPPSSLYPLELLHSLNPLVFTRGELYAKAWLEATLPSEETLWPFVSRLMACAVHCRDRDLRRKCVGLMQLAVEQGSAAVCKVLLQKTVETCEEASIAAVLLHHYKERIRVELDAVGDSKQVARPCFATEAGVRWLLQCLQFQNDLEALILRCDVFCAALNCYRFVLLRDKTNVTQLRAKSRQDCREFVEPLLLAVIQAQRSVESLSDAALAQLSFPGPAGLSRLQMVEDLAKRVTEIVQA